MEAIKHFESGYSCSESLVMEGIDLGICDKSLLPVATAFCAGLSSGCLCGAISGAMMVISTMYGKNNKYGNEMKAKQLAAEFIKRFKEKFPATCCRVLSRGYEFQSAERREHCKEMVKYCSELMKELAVYEKV